MTESLSGLGMAGIQFEDAVEVRPFLVGHAALAGAVREEPMVLDGIAALSARAAVQVDLLRAGAVVTDALRFQPLVGQLDEAELPARGRVIGVFVEDLLQERVAIGVAAFEFELEGGTDGEVGVGEVGGRGAGSSSGGDSTVKSRRSIPT